MTAHDRAIGTAEWLFASPRRIGTIQPQEVLDRELDRVALLPNSDIVDAEVRTDFTGHGYFLSNPAVLSDVILVLRYDRKPGAENDRPLTELIPNYYVLDDGYPGQAAPLPAAKAAAARQEDDTDDE